MRTLIYVAVLSMSLLHLEAKAQLEKIAGSAATSVVLEQIFSRLTDMIDHATDQGDYLLVRAGIQAKEALQEWERVNTNLLDKAFKDIDSRQRELFNQTSALIDQANTHVENRFETAQQISETASQVVAGLPVVGGQSYVLRFMPRIVPPGSTDFFSVRIRGVNLDKAEPLLIAKTGDLVPSQPGPLEAQFEVPISEVPRHESKIIIHPLRLRYKSLVDGFRGRIFGMREQVIRELAVVTLPRTMGSYELSGTRTYMRRVDETFTQKLPAFRGTNTRAEQVALPKQEPGKSWRWALDKEFKIKQGRGEAGSCEAIDQNTWSERGVPVIAKLKKIQDRDHPLGAPAYVHCSLEGNIYRMEEVTERFGPSSGVLSWVADKPIDLPADTSTIRLTVKTFDGRTREITGTGADKFFRVRREPAALVISPVLPADVGQ